MATVGEWKRSGVQAMSSAGGRLIMGGKWRRITKRKGVNLLGWQNCTNILSNYPDFVTTLLMYGLAWGEKTSDGFMPAFPQQC